MTSAQYDKLYRLLLERRVATPRATDPAAQRATMDAEALPVGDDVHVRATVLGGVPAEMVAATGAAESDITLYVHGGGFCVGSLHTHRKLAGDVSRASGTTCAVIDYRLAPEHPLPAAIDDCVAAYSALVDSHGADRIVIAGDSAGATIAVMALTRLAANGLPMPVASVAISPWIDYRCAGPDYSEKAAVDPVILRSELLGYADWVLADQDPLDPAVTPLTAELRGLPPLLVHSGTRDVTSGDADTLAARARDAGVDVTHRVAPDMFHVWHVFAGRVPESTVAVCDVGAFVRCRLAQGAPVSA
jgi:monoterpene epsilon-lactone hydrolase